MIEELELASAFPRTTRQDWLAQVERVLKGADFEKKLVFRSREGIVVQPLYEKAEETHPPLWRGEPGPWQVLQRIDHPDPAEANRLALADLEGGASGLVLALAGAATARGFGLPLTDAGALTAALSGVLLELVRIRLETAPFDGARVAAIVAEHVTQRGLPASGLDIDFGLDPVGDFARTGRLPLAWPDLAARLAGTVADLRGRGFARGLLRVDTRAWHEAGAGPAQELAAALATGVTYLRALDEAGIAPQDAAPLLSFLMSADADAFFTLAKFRALRRLWARVEEACGLAPRPIRLDAETAWRMATKRDPWVNMLRVTVATFSSALGGADGITVLPFTAALGLPDGFARRMARNTQLILAEESNLWRVADPSAGSGAFEALTGALCEKAWGLFQAIEHEGGIVASLAAGREQARIAETREKARRDVATRRAPITGTSEFPHLAEAPVAVLMPAPETTGPALPDEVALEAEPLPSARDAEPFEALRDASDDALTRSGRRPSVFLANLGPLAAFTVRSTFARNFFEAGGIPAATNDGFATAEGKTDIAALAAAFSESGASVACLCGTDEAYEAEGEAAAAALKAAGAAAIWLAGRPAEPLAGRLAGAGVGEYIFIGCDALALLAKAQAVAMPAAGKGMS